VSADQNLVIVGDHYEVRNADGSVVASGRVITDKDAYLREHILQSPPFSIEQTKGRAFRIPTTPPILEIKPGDYDELVERKRQEFYNQQLGVPYTDEEAAQLDKEINERPGHAL